MFARNFGLSCFVSLKITNFFKQTFFKDSKKIKLNHQKGSVSQYFLKIVTVPMVLFQASAGTVVLLESTVPTSVEITGHFFV